MWLYGDRGESGEGRMSETAGCATMTQLRGGKSLARWPNVARLCSKYGTRLLSIKYLKLNSKTFHLKFSTEVKTQKFLIKR